MIEDTERNPVPDSIITSVERYVELASESRRTVLESVLTKGLLPPNKHLMTMNTATRNGTIIDQVAEEEGISCALVFNEHMRGVHVKEDEKLGTFSYSLALNDAAVAGDTQYAMSADKLSNPSSEQDASIQDAMIDGVLYGKAYFGGMHSIFPVMAERRAENMASQTRYLDSQLLGRRIQRCVLIVAPIEKVGLEAGDAISQTEFRVSGRGIAKDSFLVVLVPEELADEVESIKKAIHSDVEVRIVKSVEKRVPIAHVFAKTTVPDFESALKKLCSEQSSPLVVHGVRLPDETDFILGENTELVKSLFDINKVLNSSHAINPDSFGDEEVKHMCELYGGVMDPKLLAERLREHSGYTGD
jgi:hypothetical protein